MQRFCLIKNRIRFKTKKIFDQFYYHSESDKIVGECVFEKKLRIRYNKIQSVYGFPIQTVSKQMKGFQGTVNYLRNVIFSTISKSLQQLLADCN